MKSKEERLTGTNNMRKKNRMHTVIFVIICILLVFGPGSEIVISAYSCSAARKVRSLLSPSAPIEGLPQEVTLTIEGNTATFTKGSDSYGSLLSLLRSIHSENARKEAGEPPLGDHKFTRGGEFVVRHLGMPFRCRLYRSTTNTNYVQIAIPYGNNRPGHALPWILDNNKLGMLVRSHLAPINLDQKDTIRGEQSGGEERR